MDSVHDFDEVSVMHVGIMRVTVGDQTVELGPGEIHTPVAVTDFTLTFIALTPRPVT